MSYDQGLEARRDPTKLFTGGNGSAGAAGAKGLQGGDAARPRLDSALVSIARIKGIETYAVSVAEELAKPQDIDVGSLNELLGKLQSAITKENVATGVQSIKLSKKEQEENTKKAQDAQNEALKKAKEAADASPNSSLMNWLMAAGAIVAAVLAVAGAISSFGVGTAAAVFAVTGAVAAVTTASMAVANAQVHDDAVQITNYDGTKEQMDVSWGGMVNKIVDQQLEDGTMVEIHKDGDTWKDRHGRAISTAEMLDSRPGKYKTVEQISDWKMAWGITANVMMLLVSLASAGGSMAAANGAVKSAKTALDMGKNVAESGAKIFAGKVDRIAEAVGGVADLADAGVGMYQGIKTIEVAEIKADSERARANHAFYEALLQEISSRMKSSEDMVQELVGRLNEVYDQMFAGLASVNRTMTTTARNMG